MSEPQTMIQEQLSYYNWGILGNQGYVLGIDLGVYGLRTVLVDLHTHTFHTAALDRRGSNPNQMLNDVVALVRKLLDEAGASQERLMRIGVGFGGPVDPQRGIIRISPRMSGWENFPLQQHLEEAFDTPTVIDNDANLIALGEATFGVGREVENLFYLHLSSGVGGGIVIDNRLYQGFTATAGEIGHAVVCQTTDSSSKLPTLEELVSINGILQRATYAGFPTDNLHDIFSNHPVGQSIVRETSNLLAMHLAQVVALLDPQMIVLGGIVVRIGGNQLVDRIAQQMNQYFGPEFARPVEVVKSALGADSVTVGALALALDSLRD